MKKVFSIVFAILVLTGTAEARKVKGTVTGEGKALSGVIVTDGVNFASTDAKGQYSLKVEKDAKFVSVVTPTGYTAPFSSGTSEFYKLLGAEKVYDFQLLPFGNTDDFTLFSISDPQMKPEHFAKFAAEPLDDIVKEAAKYSAQGPTVAIALGDIGWNILSVFGDYKAGVAKAGIPFYAVIGNHDHNQERGGKAACEGFEAAFGPVNWAFWLGKDLVIGLDNLLFTGNDSGDPSKTGKYKEGYSEETLAFVKNLLQRIPKDTHLFIAQHSPLYHWFNESNPYIQRGEELLNLLEGRSVDFLSGHTHMLNNLVYGDDIREHTAASICGAWWSTKRCNDGTPRGYEIFENRDGVLTWAWHNVDEPDDFQVEFIEPGQTPRHPNSLVANVWDYDPSWTVSWTQDGVYMGELEEASDVSPVYVREIRSVYPDKISNYKRPRKNVHYFAATPSQYAHKVGIEVVNPAGKKWSYEFDMTGYIDVQGHRGGAGLMPENTIESQIFGIRLGMNTCEMDFQLSKDGKVVVSHENYFHPNYCTDPDGNPVTKESGKTYLYKLDYEEIAKWDTGLRGNPRFPDVKKMPAHKPLASDLIDAVETYTKEHGYSPVRYNIEVKSSAKKGEGTNWAEYHELTDKILELVESKNLGDRAVIQCFDVRALQYMHEAYPSFFLSYLTSEEPSVEELMDLLGFVPDWWSPHYSVITPENVQWCHERGIKVVPWTVDEPEDIQRMIDCGVDSIISNYPDRVLKITRGFPSVTYAKEPL